MLFPWKLSIHITCRMNATDAYFKPSCGFNLSPSDSIFHTYGRVFVKDESALSPVSNVHSSLVVDLWNYLETSLLTRMVTNRTVLKPSSESVLQLGNSRTDLVSTQSNFDLYVLLFCLFLLPTSRYFAEVATCYQALFYIKFVHSLSGSDPGLIPD